MLPYQCEKIIPGILLRPVYEAAKKVAIGDAKTLSDRRVRAIEAFQKMGVAADRVLAGARSTCGRAACRVAGEGSEAAAFAPRSV